MDFAIPDSPVSDELVQLLESLQQQANDTDNDNKKRGITDALYLVAIKRWNNRPFTEPVQDYLQALVGDIENAKWEFSEVCYANEHSSDTFFELKLQLVSLMANLQSE